MNQKKISESGLLNNFKDTWSTSKSCLPLKIGVTPYYLVMKRHPTYMFPRELILDGDIFDLEATEKFNEKQKNEELMYMITKEVVNTIECQDKIIK